MSQAPRSEWTESRALLQNRAREYLIQRRPESAGDGGPDVPAGPPRAESARGDTGEPLPGPWQFPGGRLRDRESPEAGLRRICRQSLGIELEIFEGQPPFVHESGGHAVEFRYYLCGVARGSVDSGDPDRFRWVLAAQLREYEFDPPAQLVADWLLSDTNR